MRGTVCAMRAAAAHSISYYKACCTYLPSTIDTAFLTGSTTQGFSDSHFSPMNHLRLFKTPGGCHHVLFFRCVKIGESTNMYKALEAGQIWTIHIQFFQCVHLLNICLFNPAEVMTTVIKSLQESFSHWSTWTTRTKILQHKLLKTLEAARGREKMWIRGKIQM